MLHILIVKIFTKRTRADKFLRDKAFNIAKDPKHDGYQRGLTSMVYKLFDKKSASLADKSMKGSGLSHNIKYTPQNKQLAEELHKPIIREFKQKKCMQYLKIIFEVLIYQIYN